MTDASQNPFDLFTQWYEEAVQSETHNPNAMCLASSTPLGCPSARMVLLKEFDSSGFVFYTNVESQKGQELLTNPQAALCFYWKSTNKQIRIEGLVSLVDDKQSNQYFASRPRDSQIGAWASKQSCPMKTKDSLQEDVKKYEQQFQGTQTIERPSTWAGFILKPNRIEFWTEKPHRLHERLVFSSHKGETKEASWNTEWLYP